MIYDLPARTAPIDQGDLIVECPILAVTAFDPQLGKPTAVEFEARRVLVVTQTCDLANQKATSANVVEVFEAQMLVDQGTLKAADVKGPLRAGRVWGWYFLPAALDLGLAEMVVDFRRLHTVRLDLLQALCDSGRRPGRVRPLYREHLAKHFADTFSRIGLPRPYETM